MLGRALFALEGMSSRAIAPVVGCHFTSHWSEEDGEWVGLVREFESLSWLAATSEDALAGIRGVVADVMEDVASGGDLPD